VRFADIRAISAKVARAVRLALLASSSTPSFSSALWAGLSSPSPRALENDANLSNPNITFKEFSEPSLQKQALANTNVQPTIGVENHIPLLRVVGQVGATYIVAEGPDGLYLIDQHAAHERVLYEQLKKNYFLNHDAQLLLEPLLFVPNPHEAEMLSFVEDLMKEIGFQIELFGPTTYAIRAVPAFMKHPFSLNTLKDILYAIDEENSSLLEKEKEEIFVRAICKSAAVKGGTILSKEEQENLVRELETCQNPRTCPHGRPTMLHISVDILEKQFGRKGAR